MYLGLFSCREDVEREFDIKLPDGLEILFAAYDYEDYSGNAFVLCRDTNGLYEVNGSHCSCYGLEDQWSLELTTVAALRLRDLSGYSGSATNQKFTEVLEALA